MSAADLDATLRARDEDRWLASRFAPAPIRSGLAALLAFNDEIARTSERVSEPMLGEIRLQWWREALEEISAGGPVRAHDVAQALASEIEPAKFAAARPHLDALIDARARDLDPEPFADIPALETYAAGTAGPVVAAGLAVIGAPAEDALAETCGRAWGLTGLLRAFAARAAAGRLVLPVESCAAAGLRPAEAAAGREPEKTRAAMAPVLDAAQAAYERARHVSRAAPPAAWPAYGYVALCAGYLKRLAAPDRDPFADHAERSLLSRQAALFVSALLGRV